MAAAIGGIGVCDFGWGGRGRADFQTAARYTQRGATDAVRRLRQRTQKQWLEFAARNSTTVATIARAEPGRERSVSEAAAAIITAGTFMSEVVEASANTPVLVDF